MNLADKIRRKRQAQAIRKIADDLPGYPDGVWEKMYGGKTSLIEQMQAGIWTDADGVKHYVRDMRTGHLIRVVKMLRRNAPYIAEQYYRHVMACFLSDDSPRGLLQGLAEMMLEANHIEDMARLFPFYSVALDELRRRGVDVSKIT